MYSTINYKKCVQNQYNRMGCAQTDKITIVKHIGTIRNIAHAKL